MEREARLFEELDSTTSTSAKVEALARYFSEANDRDKVWVIALLSGRRPKRPVTGTQMRKWAAEMAAIPDWLFDASYHVVGDLAETVSLVAKPGPPMQMGLAEWVRYVEDLRRCSEEEKAERTKAAWAGLRGMDLFVFNKIITGAFRIGVSQRTMVKGLAMATRIDEDLLSHRLMGKWDPHTTGFAELVLEENADEHQSRPYPFYLAYGLEGETGRAAGAGLEQLQQLGPPQAWTAEYKWDGIRGQLIVRNGQHHVWSRGEELVTDKYPEFGTLRDKVPDGTVLDGEILAWKDNAPLPFAELQKRIGRKTIGKKLLNDVPVVFMAYDIMEHNGRDIRDLPLEARRAMLESCVADAADPHLLLSRQLPFNSWEEIVTYRGKARAGAVEGVMLKHKGSSYEVGRKRGQWWKWKLDPMSIDAVLTFSMQGHGRRANLYTDHTFGVWHEGELVTFAKAYSGLTDEEMRQVDAYVRANTVERFGPVRQVVPRLVFEIAFEGISASSRHKSGVAVRFPRIARWRHDKQPADANSLADLKALIP